MLRAQSRIRGGIRRRRAGPRPPQSTDQGDHGVLRAKDRHDGKHGACAEIGQRSSKPINRPSTGSSWPRSGRIGHDAGRSDRRLRPSRLRHRYRAVSATPCERRARRSRTTSMSSASPRSAARLALAPRLKAGLVNEGRDDIMIVVGGVVPPQDYPSSARRRGSDLPPGTVIAEPAELLCESSIDDSDMDEGSRVGRPVGGHRHPQRHRAAAGPPHQRYRSPRTGSGPAAPWH